MFYGKLLRLINSDFSDRKHSISAHNIGDVLHQEL